MDVDNIGNGGIGKTALLVDVMSSSSSALAHVINNPLDDGQTSAAHDSGCYSSAAEEWLQMHPYSSNTNNPDMNQAKQRKSTLLLDLERKAATAEPFDKVVINVSGLRFETRASTLQCYPHTLLGDKQRRAHFFDYMNNEYFFERHRSSFEAILYFYQSDGRLTRPDNIPAEIFLEEIKFFDLGDEVLKRYRKQEGYVEEIPVERPSNDLQRAIWEAFECPGSSNIARAVAVISIVMITVSIATFIVETIPSIRESMTHPVQPPSSVFIGNMSNAYNSKPPSGETRNFWVFFIIETICVTWFCFEVICRFLVAPSKFAFIKNGPNIIDVVSIVPYFLQLIGLIYQKKDSSVSGFSSTLTVLRIVRLVRVFRIFKLSRHFKGLQVLALTFLASWKELLLLMFFLFIIVIVFSSFMYFVESDYSPPPPTVSPPPLPKVPMYMPTSSSPSCTPCGNSLANYESSLATMTTTVPTNPNQFVSIPHSFWFSIITMTTVGYGDFVPRTNLGKVIGAACALTGVLTIALPVPIIVSNFTYFYQRQLEDNERQYQARQRQAHQTANEKGGSSNDKDRGPEHNEWETTYNEPDYSDYRDITHAVTKKLVRNAYFKAFRGSKRISPAMRFQSLPSTTLPHQLTHRLYHAMDDKNNTRRDETDLETAGLLH